MSGAALRAAGSAFAEREFFPIRAIVAIIHLA
jgi:hypothetical protein